VKHCCNDTVAGPLCRPEIPHASAWFWTLVSVWRNMSQGTAPCGFRTSNFTWEDVPVLLWENEGLHTEFYVRRLKQRDHLEDLDVDGTTTLNKIVNMMGWRGPFSDMDMCWAAVNMMMNIRGTMEWGIFVDSWGCLSVACS